MIDFVVGAGQGGCRIAKTFAEEFEAPAAYMNLARVDFSQLEVPEDRMLLIDAGGTGRSPEVGEKIAAENKELIRGFLEEKLVISKGDKALVAVGGGGGSGAGMMYAVIGALLRKKVDVLLLYTLPERREGLPAKPNALKSLNKIITRYLEKPKVSCLVVDNSFCVERFAYGGEGELSSYWEAINHGIVHAIQRYWHLTNLDHYTNFIDVNAGYGALDERELLRVLFTKGGFVDLREFVCDEPSPVAAAEAQFRSLVFGNLDISSTKNYIVTVGFPYGMKGDPRVSTFQDAIFKKLERVTQTPFVLRSSHFNREISQIHVNVLLSGMTKSHGLKKIVKQTVRDVSKYQAKNTIEKLDLSEINL